MGAHRNRETALTSHHRRWNFELLNQNKKKNLVLICDGWHFEADLLCDAQGPFSGAVIARRLMESSENTPPPQIITGKYCSPFDLFGASLAFSGHRLFVGAPLQDLAFEDSGSVHIFSLVGEKWRQEEILTPDVPAPCQWFGSAIASSGDLLAVSAPSSGFTSQHSGEVSLFEKSGEGWQLISKISSPVPASLYSFGSTLEWTGTLLTITSRARPISGEKEPAVLEYEVSQCLGNNRKTIPAVLPGASSSRFSRYAEGSKATSGEKKSAGIDVGHWRVNLENEREPGQPK